MGYSFPFSSLLWKYILNWIENSDLNFRLLYCLRFQVLLDVPAYLQKTSSFFNCLNVCAENFFSKVFIVLGMYNFELNGEILQKDALTFLKLPIWSQTYLKIDILFNLARYFTFALSILKIGHKTSLNR